jgi:hypothetical protein
MVLEQDRRHPGTILGTDSVLGNLLAAGGRQDDAKPRNSLSLFRDSP